jgi:N-acetylmuramoyl-L-alanine amidase
VFIMRRNSRTASLAATTIGLACALLLSAAPAGTNRAEAETTVEPAATSLPLAGKVVLIDPGHQLGNKVHPTQINRLVNAGGFYKPCNTTGTATVSGYPESAFAMSVANNLKRRLTALGARVYMTRTVESLSLWGPCVDVRGRWGGAVHADATISIHADGAASSLHGFFVIYPALRRGWTDDIYGASVLLARDVHTGLRLSGLPNANYYGGGGFDSRGDLGTLNWSSVPVVMVEMGNMKNATDATMMKTATRRDQTYSAGLAKGLTLFLTRP